MSRAEPPPERNPQAAQMGDESMVRNLAAQAIAIWPQEARLFERYQLPARAQIADVGCGTGEITSRLAQLYPEASLLGVDVLPEPLAHAREKHAALAPRVRFEPGDAFHLNLPDGAFDLVVCRHVTQAVPEPHKVIAELHRICRPGGFVHVLSEDYGMLHIAPGEVDPNKLWWEGVVKHSRSTGTDEQIGRKTWSIMRQLGFTELQVDYVIVDTLRVPRATFAEIIRAWRDGYTESLERYGDFEPGEVRTLFDAAIGSLMNPDAYSVWQIPVVSGRKP